MASTIADERHKRSFLGIEPPVWCTFLVLFAWSGYAYATERVNGDIVAEVIQVQRWLREPFWVLSYPGQLHGGILEYPLIALAETLTPGNPYGFTFIRMAYIPIAAVLILMSVRRAFPAMNMWPFVIAAAAGPAVMHGFRMISDIYPFAWLIGAMGVFLLYRALAEEKGKWAFAVSGVLLGLSVYEHASSIAFLLPMVVAGLYLYGTHWRLILYLVAGGLLGLIPMALAQFAQPDAWVVYQPAEPGFPDLLAIFGFKGAAWEGAMFPNGIGIQHVDQTLLGIPRNAQMAVNAMFLIGIIGVSVKGIGLLPRYGREINVYQYVGLLWLFGILSVIILGSVVSPIWYYGTGLGFLVWISVALLWPQLMATKLGLARLVIVALVGWIAVMFALSLGALANKEPLFLEGARFKAGNVQWMQETGRAIELAGVKYLYGAYWEILPIAYSTNGAVIPITYNFDRFEVPEGVTADSVVTVAVSTGQIALPYMRERWDTAEQAQQLVNENCTMRTDLASEMPDGINAYDCPAEVLFAPLDE